MGQKLGFGRTRGGTSPLCNILISIYSIMNRVKPDLGWQNLEINF
jgi:hypothetical protein